MTKIRDKSPVTKDLMREVEKAGKKSPFWKAVLKGLNRPRSVQYKVNLHDLQKKTKDKESIVIPGKILGSGEISKPLDITAFQFSIKAKEKIEKAGGKVLSIQDLIKKNPTGKGLRIMG